MYTFYKWLRTHPTPPSRYKPRWRHQPLLLFVNVTASTFSHKNKRLALTSPAFTFGRWYRVASLSRDDVLKLAQLARLDLTDEEVEEYSRELTEILHYVEQLQSVDVAGLGPTNQVTGLTNVTRPDEVKNYGYDPKELLKNVPSVEADHIKVKRMIG